MHNRLCGRFLVHLVRAFRHRTSKGSLSACNQPHAQSSLFAFAVGPNHLTTSTGLGVYRYRTSITGSPVSRASPNSPNHSVASSRCGQVHSASDTTRSRPKCTEPVPSLVWTHRKERGLRFRSQLHPELNLSVPH
jgi:hypothetical protein